MKPTTAVRLLIWAAGLAATGACHALSEPAVAPVDDPAFDRPELLTEDSARGHGDVPAPVESRQQAIARELAELRGEHRWAGSYYEGDGLGENVRLQIAPTSGAAVTWVGCLGLYGANEGGLKQDADGTLQIDFNWKNEERGFGGFPKSLVPVAWGERSYLIPPESLIDFVNAINGGIEPRERGHGGFYLREGDADKPVSGLPELPVEYKALIRTEQKIFAVRQIERAPDRKSNYYCVSVWRVTIATDGDDKLRVGSELTLAGAEDQYVQAKVIEINPSTAVAEIHGDMRESCSDSSADDPKPTTDWQFASGRYESEAKSLD